MSDREFRPLPQGSALVSAVHPRHLRKDGPRTTISLRAAWPALLEDMPSFGRVLSICRNRYAVLGRLGDYPRMAIPACGHCAGSPDGTLSFFLYHWVRALAAVEEKSAGWLYSAEFTDAHGDVLHKLCLSADSHYEAFHDWVLRHQAPSPEPPAETFRPLASPVHNAAGICPECTLFLEDGALTVLLREAMREKVRLRCVVGNEGAVLGADLTPESLEEKGQWIFASDPQTGLHLRTGRLAELTLEWAEACDGPSYWMLKAYEPEGRLAFAIVPPKVTEEWNSFLLQATQKFHIP